MGSATIFRKKSRFLKMCVFWKWRVLKNSFLDNRRIRCTLLKNIKKALGKRRVPIFSFWVGHVIFPVFLPVVLQFQSLLLQHLDPITVNHGSLDTEDVICFATVLRCVTSVLTFLLKYCIRFCTDLQFL